MYWVCGLNGVSPAKRGSGPCSGRARAAVVEDFEAVEAGEGAFCGRRLFLTACRAAGAGRPAIPAPGACCSGASCRAAPAAGADCGAAAVPPRSGAAESGGRASCGMASG